MRTAKQAHLLVAAILVVGLCGPVWARDWEELRGPYLGQNPPGAVPEIFAPGIVSTDDVNHCSVAVSPDGSRIAFSTTSSCWKAISAASRWTGWNIRCKPPPVRIVTGVTSNMSSWRCCTVSRISSRVSPAAERRS